MLLDFQENRSVELFTYFYSKNYIGIQREQFFNSKIALNHPVVYASDRSEAVVLVLFLLCVTLWFVLRGVS